MPRGFLQNVLPMLSRRTPPRLADAILCGFWQPLAEEALSTKEWWQYKQQQEARVVLQQLLNSSGIGETVYMFEGKVDFIAVKRPYI